MILDLDYLDNNLFYIISLSQAAPYQEWVNACFPQNTIDKLILSFSQSSVSFLFQSYAFKSSYWKLWDSVFIMQEQLHAIDETSFAFVPLELDETSQNSFQLESQVFWKNHKSYLYRKANFFWLK